MNQSHFNRGIITAVIDASRVLADALEATLTAADGSREPDRGAMIHEAAPPATDAGTEADGAGGETSGSGIFDPLSDELPLHADPVGSPEQRKMAYLAYLGAVRAINVREERGATPVEVRKYAMKAGYPDGRAVSGFSNRGGSTYSQDGARWMNEDGVAWLNELQAELGLELPEDLR